MHQSPSHKPYLAWRTMWLLVLLGGCSPLSRVPYLPLQTPAEWLMHQPVMTLSFFSRPLIIVQPSTSAIVYLLGILTIAVGILFLRRRETQLSRTWWGIALLLWGLGALLAGTSYEAFSYQIKCVGQSYCSWTSWWEVVYLILSVGSVDALLAATAFTSTEGTAQKMLTRYAWMNFCVYTLAALIGALLPVPFLISFELLVLVCAPSIVILLGINAWRAWRKNLILDRYLFFNWLWLGITLGAYFLYNQSGFTQRLWQQGIWFSDNDVLHIGLIIWILYQWVTLLPRLRDNEPGIAPVEALP